MVHRTRRRIVSGAVGVGSLFAVGGAVVGAGVSVLDAFPEREAAIAIAARARLYGARAFIAAAARYVLSAIREAEKRRNPVGADASSVVCCAPRAGVARRARGW